MPKLVDKRLLREMHQPGWAAFWLFLFYGVVAHVLFGAIAWAVYESQFVLLVPVVLLQAFAMHAFLIAFHESAHGALCSVGWLNGYFGRVIGLMSGMSLSLYRAAHHWHHAYIGDKRDEEFWPLNDPAAPLWKRRIAALLELTCGLVWTPFLFLRAFFRRDSAIRDTDTRRLIWLELTGMVLLWTAIVALVVWFEALWVVVFGYLLPAWIAGNVQSLRKYVEHVGLIGTRGLALTRSVRNSSRLGRFVSWLLFHEPYHDVHHLYPKVPQESLPTVAAAENPLPPELPVFPSYRAALLDLIRGLSDPKFGKAWATEPLIRLEVEVARKSESSRQSPKGVCSSVGTSAESAERGA
jgi:fatty acid desaturase